jgi:uncharacterized protein (TIGR04255 family)
MVQLPAPFGGPPPDEVALPRPPLVRVIGQIVFPTLAKIAQPTALAPFQESIRSSYPVLTQEEVQHIEMQPTAAPRFQRDIIWRFSSADGNWRVSLSPSFVALETRAYTSRTEFVGRLMALATALQLTMDPQLYLRVGLRYINRMEGEALARIATLIKAEVLGVLQTPFKDAAQHLITESILRTDEGQLLARWGSLPANATVDPQAVEPIAAPSWVFDLDISATGQWPFEAAAIGDRLLAFAKRNYAVFRFVVKEDFLIYYGGKP